MNSKSTFNMGYVSVGETVSKAPPWNTLAEA